jgi:hypothetical protein
MTKERRSDRHTFSLCRRASPLSLACRRRLKNRDVRRRILAGRPSHNGRAVLRPVWRWSGLENDRVLLLDGRLNACLRHDGRPCGHAPTRRCRVRYVRGDFRERLQFLRGVLGHSVGHLGLNLSGGLGCTNRRSRVRRRFCGLRRCYHFFRRCCRFFGRAPLHRRGQGLDRALI